MPKGEQSGSGELHGNHRNAICLQEENPTDASELREPRGFPGSCRSPGKPGIGRLTEVLASSLRGRGGKALAEYEMQGKYNTEHNLEAKSPSSP